MKQNDVLEQKALWETALKQLNDKAATLTQELSQVQQQVLTLSGAIEACNVLLEKFSKADTSE